MGRLSKEAAEAKKAAEQAAAQAAAAQEGAAAGSAPEGEGAGESAAGSPEAGESDAPPKFLLPNAEAKAGAAAAKAETKQAGASDEKPAQVETAFIDSPRCFTHFEDGQIVLQVAAGKHKIAGNALLAARKHCPELLRDE